MVDISGLKRFPLLAISQVAPLPLLTLFATLRKCRDLSSTEGLRSVVMHVRGDLMEPFDEGRKLAAKIPDAHFIALEGRP